jgi:hypothetical protein
MSTEEQIRERAKEAVRTLPFGCAHYSPDIERAIVFALSAQSEDDASTHREEVERLTRERYFYKSKVEQVQQVGWDISEERNSVMAQRDSARAESVQLREALRLAIEQRDSLIEAVFEEHQIDDWERRRNSEILAILSKPEGA